MLNVFPKSGIITVFRGKSNNAPPFSKDKILFNGRSNWIFKGQFFFINISFQYAFNILLLSLILLKMLQPSTPHTMQQQE